MKKNPQIKTKPYVLCNEKKQIELKVERRKEIITSLAFLQISFWAVVWSILRPEGAFLLGRVGRERGGFRAES